MEYGTRTMIYRNDGEGVFTEVNPNIVELDNSCVAWGDFDNDGRLDLLVTGTGQRGVIGGSGMNNIGLLVKTWGRVTKVGGSYLYIDDGSGLLDGTTAGSQPNIGVRVVCDPSGYMEGDILAVTGISSCFQAPGGTARQILVRGAGDVVQVD